MHAWVGVGKQERAGSVREEVPSCWLRTMVIARVGKKSEECGVLRTG